MKGFKDLVKRLYEWLCNLSTSLAELCLFALIGLLGTEVFARYVLKHSLLITYDVAGYLVVGITFLSLTYTLRTEGHIKVTLLADCLPSGFRRWLAFSVDFVALLAVILLVWQSTKLVMLNYEMQASASVVLVMPIYIPQLIVPIGLAIFSLGITLRLLTELRNLIKPRN